MADKQPNIVVFFSDNFGWSEFGCYGGEVLRGARTPRIDSIADQGLRLLNFNVEAQCPPEPFGAFLKSLAGGAPIKPGTPNPYTPPGPGQYAVLKI